MTTRKSASRLSGSPAVGATELTTLSQVQTVTGNYGTLAVNSPKYLATALNASTRAMRLVVFGDSTGDSWSDLQTPATTRWDQGWPARLAALLRGQLGLPSGGDGWIPPSTPNGPEHYSYRPATLGPAGFTSIDTGDQIYYGVPGSIWLQQSSATAARIATYDLTPGVTSVDVVVTSYGYPVRITTANTAATNYTTANPDLGRRINIVNPGAWIRIEPDTGGGFALIGIQEYVGDEVRGIRMMNYSLGGTRALDTYNWISDPARSMKTLVSQYAPDVALIVLGSNDISTGRTPEDTLAVLIGIGQQVQSVAPDCQVVYVMRENNDANFVTLITLVTAWAPTIGAQVLNLRNEPRLDVAAPGIYLPDGQHYTATGDAVMAQVMSEYLKVGVPATQATIDSSISTALGDRNTRLPRRLRRMAYGAGMQVNTVTAAITFAARGLRIPVELPVDTTRWRLRAWNFDAGTPTTAKGNQTGKSLVIGNAARDALGIINGNFIGNVATSLVSGDFTIPGIVPVGGDWYNSGVYTSPWFTADNQQFKANVTRVLGTGITQTSAATPTSEQQGMFFATATDGADPTKVNPANGWIPFTMVIEYETVTDRMCVLFLGDSIPTGITGPKAGSVTPIPTFRNYPHQWAKGNNVLVQHLGFSGATANNYNTSTSTLQAGLYGRYDLVTPDFDMIIFSMGSNDSNASRTLAQFQADVQSIWTKVSTPLRPGTPMWVINIPPRNTAQEALRQAYNEWWSQGPLGIAGVVDLDGAMTTGAATGALKAGYSLDGIHFTWQGQTRAAAELERIPTRRS